MDIVHKKPIREEVKDLRDAWKVPQETLKDELLDKHTKMVEQFYLDLFAKLYGRPFNVQTDADIMHLRPLPSGETRLSLKGIGEVGTVVTEIGRISFTPFKTDTE